MHYEVTQRALTHSRLARREEHASHETLESAVVQVVDYILNVANLPAAV